MNNTVFFVSYETIVCEITSDHFLHCYGTFSNTTARQIGWFLNQMKSDYGYRCDLACYQTAKRAYQKGIEINLYNGDERTAPDGMIQTIGIRKRDSFLTPEEFNSIIILAEQAHIKILEDNYNAGSNE